MCLLVTLFTNFVVSVGVTNSGKGMTEVASRGKHVFVPNEETV